MARNDMCIDSVSYNIDRPFKKCSFVAKLLALRNQNFTDILC